MIYFPNDSLDPAYNQAFEECAFELDTHEDILLIWRNRPAVVCGRYQNLFQEVHLPSAMDAGVDLVRRTTGGGCVYHDPGNVNYALITDLEDGAGYDAVLERTVGALQAIGVPASRGGTSAINIGDKKISGSAQRASKGRLLHHGTLLFDANLSSLRRLANGHSECYQSKAICSVPAPVTNIREHIHGKMTVEDFAAKLAEAFAPESIAEADFTGKAEALAEEKYRTWKWTFANSPKFTFARKDEDCAVGYAAEKAVIKEIRVIGPNGGQIAAALTGARLEMNELRERIGSVISDENQIENMLRRLF